MIKQREKTRVTIFRLANTSLHQVYYEDHKITECLSRYAVLQWEMMEVMMLMHGSIFLLSLILLPSHPSDISWDISNPLGLGLGNSFEAALAEGRG